MLVRPCNVGIRLMNNPLLVQEDDKRYARERVRAYSQDLDDQKRCFASRKRQLSQSPRIREVEHGSKMYVAVLKVSDPGRGPRTRVSQRGIVVGSRSQKGALTNLTQQYLTYLSTYSAARSSYSSLDRY